MFQRRRGRPFLILLLAALACAPSAARADVRVATHAGAPPTLAPQLVQGSLLASPPVLGVSGLMPYGKGWGKSRPKTIYNGGVPSGLVTKIRWTGWGSAEAQGRGKVATYRPGGGYYNKLVKIKLRALGLGTCASRPSKPAYTRLLAKVQEKPGGRYGEWFLWGLDLCDRESVAVECDGVDFPNGWWATSVTQFDSDCATAAAVAIASSGTPPVAAAGEYESVSYRFETADGFICRGFSIGYDSTISWTCLRETSLVSFTQNT